MSQLVLEQIAAFPDDDQNAICCGAAILTNGDIIVQQQIVDANPYPYVKFWGSSDGGYTWNHRSTLTNYNAFQQCRMANLPKNVLLFPFNDFNNNDAGVWRSTDAANTWTLVLDCNPSNPTGSLIQCSTILSYGRNSAIATGLLARNNIHGFYSEVARSTDFGATWNIEIGNAMGNAGDLFKVSANAGNGKFLAGHDRDGFFTSTDHGNSWTATGGMTPPGGTSQTVTRSGTWLTNEIVLAGGSLTSTGDKYFPWLWRSTDSGATWAHIDASNIDSWPTTAAAKQVTEIHRLTKNGAIIGTAGNGFYAVAPWWYSIDAGLTWKQPDTGGFNWPDYNPSATGAIVITQSGKVICPLDNRNTGGNELQIWLGTWNC